jgi:hypothetical protein
MTSEPAGLLQFRSRSCQCACPLSLPVYEVHRAHLTNCPRPLPFCCPCNLLRPSFVSSVHFSFLFHIQLRCNLCCLSTSFYLDPSFNPSPLLLHLNFSAFFHTSDSKFPNSSFVATATTVTTFCYVLLCTLLTDRRSVSSQLTCTAEFYENIR